MAASCEAPNLLNGLRKALKPRLIEKSIHCHLCYFFLDQNCCDIIYYKLASPAEKEFGEKINRKKRETHDERVLQNKERTKSNSPVDADGTEVEYTSGAHHDVQREQDVTVDETEAPLSHHLH